MRTTENLLRPFWPQYVRVGRIPECVPSAQSMRQPRGEVFFWTCMCMSFHRKFAWQVELFFFARLRTPPVQFERGMCNLISFFLGMEKPEFCFCMSYLKPNTNPNKMKPTVDVRHSHVKHCSHVEHRFLFSRITGEREALFDETLQ